RRDRRAVGGLGSPQSACYTGAMAPGDAVVAAAPVAGGGWLFRHRSWLPVPLALILLGAPWGSLRHPAIFVLGPALVASGEALRWWAVGQIGVISRTRTTRLGPL